MSVQSTIDFFENRKQRQAAHASGGMWTNPYDRGPLANWQVETVSTTRAVAVIADVPGTACAG